MAAEIRVKSRTEGLRSDLRSYYFQVSFFFFFFFFFCFVFFCFLFFFSPGMFGITLLNNVQPLFFLLGVNEIYSSDRRSQSSRPL